MTCSFNATLKMASTLSFFPPLYIPPFLTVSTAIIASDIIANCTLQSYLNTCYTANIAHMSYTPHHTWYRSKKYRSVEYNIDMKLRNIHHTSNITHHTWYLLGKIKVGWVQYCHHITQYTWHNTPHKNNQNTTHVTHLTQHMIPEGHEGTTLSYYLTSLGCYQM